MIEISLAGIQDTPGRALAHLDVNLDGKHYKWQVYVPVHADLHTWIPAQAQAIEQEMRAKLAQWQELEPKTREVTNELTGITELVPIEPEEIVKPEVPDYWLQRRAAYPDAAQQLEAVFKGERSAEFLQVLDQLAAVRNQFPKQPWIPVSAVQQQRDTLLQQLARVRWLRETAGVQFLGQTFSTDAQSQTKLLGIFVLAQADEHFQVNWKTQSGAFVVLDQAATVQLVQLARAHVQQAFDWEAETQLLIEQAQTEQQLQQLAEMLQQQQQLWSPTS